MGVSVEGVPWGHQPREGERAYVAFLAYRDLGPGRTHEATRECLGKRPGYLKPIERWSASWDWRQRARAWDDHLQAGRDKVAADQAELWEQRRLQALEQGWQLCQALRARLEQMLAYPLEPPPAAAPPAPPEGTPEAVPDPVAPPEATEAPAGRGPSRWNYTTVARLVKLVIELEWAILAEALPPPRADQPADGDDRGDQGLPGAPFPPGPPAAALSRPTPPQIASPHDRQSREPRPDHVSSRPPAGPPPITGARRRRATSRPSASARRTPSSPREPG